MSKNIIWSKPISDRKTFTWLKFYSHNNKIWIFFSPYTLSVGCQVYWTCKYLCASPKSKPQVLQTDKGQWSRKARLALWKGHSNIGLCNFQQRTKTFISKLNFGSLLNEYLNTVTKYKNFSKIFFVSQHVFLLENFSFFLTSFFSFFIFHFRRTFLHSETVDCVVGSPWQRWCIGKINVC